MATIFAIICSLFKAIPRQQFYWLCIVAVFSSVPAAGPGAFAGLCADGRPGCPDYEPEPQYALPARKNDVHAARQPRHYEPAADETLPPCEEKQYAAYGVQRYEPQPYVSPEPQGPIYHDVKEWCGIGCWYRRLTSGYCGRGCDYYLYRLNKFPEGALPKYNHKKVACR